MRKLRFINHTRIDCDEYVILGPAMTPENPRPRGKLSEFRIQLINGIKLNFKGILAIDYDEHKGLFYRAVVRNQRTKAYIERRLGEAI